MDVLSREQAQALRFLLQAAEGDSALLELALLSARSESGSEPAEFVAVLRKVLDLIAKKRDGNLQFRS